MKLIVGLGNPGRQYKKTRHNVGFIILDSLQKELHASDWTLSKKFNAEISEIGQGDDKILLVKPMTFMNHSGQAVGLIMHYYKIKLDDLIVVHDDKDIKLGEIKIQSNKNHAGHNGIKSIMEHIGTKNFMRLRVGVASENKRKMSDTSSFVLGKFGLFEKKKLEEIIGKSTLEIKNNLRIS